MKDANEKATLLTQTELSIISQMTDPAKLNNLRSQILEQHKHMTNAMNQLTAAIDSRLLDITFGKKNDKT